MSGNIKNYYSFGKDNVFILYFVLLKDTPLVNQTIGYLFPVLSPKY